MTLTEFLLARIAEDEAAAQRLIGAYNRDELRPPARLIGALVNPALVLAECEAKRRIVDLVGRLAEMTFTDDDGNRTQRPQADGWIESVVNALHVMRYLALPYADHPDYREEWRP